MIAVNNLTFGYRHDGFGLSIAELHIAKGERIAVIGPSGTGKTTLLNLLSGILLPTSGEIHFEGFNLPDIGIEDRQHLRALKMGLVFQEFELLEYLNVLDNILLSYRVSPVLELNGEVKERALQLAEDVGLGEKLKRFPHHLSQGERQRVAVCRALVTQPALILGDEPTGNLDPKNRDHIAEMLFHYTDETDAPLIVVTHDQELVTQFDRSIDVREYAS